MFGREIFSSDSGQAGCAAEQVATTRTDGPACVRRVDMDWTYADFNPNDGEHDNGEVWSATLWDIRKKLGREIADRIIVESHFQLDGFTTFARGARAIVDALADRLESSPGKLPGKS